MNDTEHTDKLHKIGTYPFSDLIITPSTYEHDLGKKHFRLKSNFEHFYLHPALFEPNSGVYELLGLRKWEKYVILRFVSWNAYHDYHQKGLSLNLKRKLIQLLESKFNVCISSEGPLEDEFKYYEINIPSDRMHDALTFAEFYIGESATMASESAVLGTYAVYVNSLPLMSYLAQEQEYGLLKHFSTGDGVFEFVEELLQNPDIKQQAIENSQSLTQNFINPTKFLT